MTKHCPLCDTDKPVEQFYKKPDAKDGRDWRCKPCAKQYMRDRYATKFRVRPLVPEGYKRCPACKRVLPKQAFDKNAGRGDGVQVYCQDCWPNYMQKWRERPESRAAAAVKSRRDARTPTIAHKRRARLLTHLAIRFGHLVPQPCEICSSTNVRAHHTQYEKPLDGIRWLCEEHHKTHGHGGAFTNPPQ